MADTQVALVRCQDYDPQRVAEAVARQFELLGGVERFVKRGDSVLLKPNFIAPRPVDEAPALTHPTVIVEVARLLKDFGARPFVSDSPAWANAATCARVLGLDEPLARLGVPIREIGSPRTCRLGPGKSKVRFGSAALDADVIINLPKFKAHQQLFMTFAVKNMFGCAAGKGKALWHYRRGRRMDAFCTLLIDIYRYMKPALTLVDGIVAMERSGPIHGQSRPLGWLIGAIDPIACETVCGRLIGVGPEQIPIVRTAKELGFGCSDLGQIDVLGDGLPAQPCSDFLLPELVPIRFTFGRVCRSATRQVMILARARSKRQCPSSDATCPASQ